MPTHGERPAFIRDFNGLSREQQRQFLDTLDKFVADLAAKEFGSRAKFRKGLRVKPYRGQQGVFEMTWADDGRALFEFGPSRVDGKIHVEWLRVGTHDIF